MTARLKSSALGDIKITLVSSDFQARKEYDIGSFFTAPPIGFFGQLLTTSAAIHAQTNAYNQNQFTNSAQPFLKKKFNL